MSGSRHYTHWQANIRKLYLYNGLSFLHLFSAVLIPFFTGWGKLSLAETLALQSWFTLCVFVLEIPTGVIADVWSRRLSLILGSIVATIGYFWYPLFSHVAAFALGEFLLALGLALRSGATEALACDSVSPAQYRRVLPRLDSLSMVGIILGPILGAIALQWVEPRWIMMSQAIPSFFSIFVALSLREPPRRIDETKPAAEATRVWDTFLTGWHFLRQHREIQVLALDMSVVAGVAKMMVWLYQARLDSLIAEQWFGWITATAVLLELLAMNLYGWLTQHGVSRSRVIFLSGALPVFGFLLAGLSTHVVLILIGVYLAIGFGMSRKPFFAVMYNERISSGQRATILSTIAMTSQLFLAVLNPVIGRMADWSVTGTFTFLGVLLAGFVLLSSGLLKGQSNANLTVLSKREGYTATT